MPSAIIIIILNNTIELYYELINHEFIRLAATSVSKYESFYGNLTVIVIGKLCIVHQQKQLLTKQQQQSTKKLFLILISEISISITINNALITF